ncbi:TPA: AfaD family invasin [Salmonella enterica subsp. enterica serovar Saintpaul]|uniref:AfaD family invasin n=1 Tax=Escherichia coli TaxID=562 RepID=UPI000A187029|nr:AfaD family invasin [Escherichia coli]OSL20954.1 protein AggB [Escherichia coli TA255]
MKKSILAALTGAVLTAFSCHLQAAEVDIVLHHRINSDLRDGMKIATGRIICRGTHTGFQVWINTHQLENSPGHYIIKGKRDDSHVLRVRIDGAEWSPSVTNDHEGAVRSYSQNGQVVFDVVADGNQHVAQDEYIYPVAGECL